MNWLAVKSHKKAAGLLHLTLSAALMPSYGSNDGYGRQQFGERPATHLTVVGQEHSSGKNMASLLGGGDALQRSGTASPEHVWGEPKRSGSGSWGRDSGERRGSSAGALLTEAELGAAFPVNPVPAPKGAGRTQLLAALEAANAAIRQQNEHVLQLTCELRAAGTNDAAARTLQSRVDELEAEQLELVGAMDSLAREKAALQAELRGLRDEIRTRDVQLAAQELVGSAKAGGGRSSGGSGGGGSRSSFSGGRSSSDGSLGRPGPGMLERTLSRPFGRSRSDGKEVSL